VFSDKHSALLRFATGARWQLIDEEQGQLLIFAKELEQRTGRAGLVIDPPPVSLRMRRALTPNARREIGFVALALALLVPARLLCAAWPPIGYACLGLVLAWLVLLALGERAPPIGPLQRLLRRGGWGSQIALPLSLAIAASLGLLDAQRRAGSRRRRPGARLPETGPPGPPTPRRPFAACRRPSPSGPEAACTRGLPRVAPRPCRPRRPTHAARPRRRPCSPPQPGPSRASPRPRGAEPLRSARDARGAAPPALGGRDIPRPATHRSTRRARTGPACHSRARSAAPAYSTPMGFHRDGGPTARRRAWDENASGSDRPQTRRPSPLSSPPPMRY
jgi:hypothetical protein